MFSSTDRLRSYIITGVAEGLGAHLLEFIARNDRSALLFVMDKQKVKRPLATCEENFVFIQGDIADEDKVDELMGAVDSSLLGTDTDYGKCVLINNASENELTWSTSTKAMRILNRLLRVNVAAQIDLISKFILNTPERLVRKVIQVSSVAARVAMRASMPYNVTKAAQDMIVKQGAREHAAKNVWIYGVRPGPIVGTAMTDDVDGQVMELRGWTLEEMHAYEKMMIPIGRRIDAKEVIDVIWFLADKAPPAMTGAILDVAGGQ